MAVYKKIWKTQLTLDETLEIDYSSHLNILSGTAKLTIGKCVLIRRFCNFLVSDSGVLTIGNNVFFNNYCSVNCLMEICIGDDTIFGEGVRLYDHNHGFRNINKPIYKQAMVYGRIMIGRNCWIGSNTVILPNVVIGDNVVIGANNLIYKSVPSNTIVKVNTQHLLENYND